MKDYTDKDGDTVKLLRECDAGIKMGISAIDDVMNDVKNHQFRIVLSNCKAEHEKLAGEILNLLDDHNDDGKSPTPMAKSMSWLKTNMKIMAKPNDSTIADLMIDGCNMGVKSLNKYLNQYKSADNKSRDITKRLVKIESDLTQKVYQYL
jgi:hypothetical protein